MLNDAPGESSEFSGPDWREGSEFPDIIFNATVTYDGDYQDLQYLLAFPLLHLGQELAGRQHDQGHYLTT